MDEYDFSDDRRRAIFAAGSNDQAAKCVVLAEQWLLEHPRDLGVIHEYAEMLYTMARYEEAIRVYQDAAEVFIEDRWAIFNQLGHLYRYRGEFSHAEYWYERAIDEDPDDATPYIFLGAVQARQGHLLQAEESHRTATNCSDGCVDEAFHNLGLVLRGQGRYAEAVVCFQRAIEIDPDYAVAIEALQDVTEALRLLGAE